MEEISALKAEISELRNSQAFIYQQYDDLKSNKKEIDNLKSDSENLKFRE